MNAGTRTILLAWLIPAQLLLAQERTEGARLAAAFEAETDARKRAKLLDQIGALEAPDKASFVSWARQRRANGEGWTSLAPALAALGTPAAVTELAEVASSNAESSGPAFQALCSLPPASALPHLIRGLGSEDRRAQSMFGTVVMERLQAAPAQVLSAIQLALSSAQPEESARLRTMLRGLTCETMAKAKPEVVVAFMRLDEPSIAAGVAQGVGQAAIERRSAAAAQARRRKADDEEPPAVEMEPVWLEAAVAALAREEPVVLVEACNAVAAVVGVLEPGEPGGSWARRLMELLGHEDKHVGHAAWCALKHVSGVDKPQSLEAWQKYWELHRGGVGDAD